MRQFFKFFTASCLGTIVGLLLIAGISTAVFARIAAKAEKAPSIQSNSILWLKLDKELPERTNNLEMNPFDVKNSKILGLHDLQLALKAAAKDERIKGIFLDLEAPNVSGEATIATLHQALEDFQKSGKFIFAYGNYYTQDSYYLASTADRIFLNPMGSVDFRGFGAIIPFFKDMLDKIGVEMQVFYAGEFKSATEPYRFNKMSDNNRLQVREYVDSLYTHFLNDISEARKIPVDTLFAIANEYRLRNAEAAIHNKIVDQLAYRDEILDAMKERIGLEKKDNLRAVTPENYFLAEDLGPDYSIKDKIAVVYAEGSIVGGEGDPGSIGDKKYMNILKSIRNDSRVKALVLRINSPGGSALASENIWREIELCKSEGLPVVVSMGDYAASGGYYLSAAADTILAEPNTLTGSIGVFFMLPNTYELFDEKLGISFDTVNTGKFSTRFTPMFPLNSEEVQIMKGWTEDIYQRFIQRVAEGRNMPEPAVRAIAEGRVWTGTRAVEIGLADRLGTLDDAVEIAADLAGLEKYRLSEYPRIKDPVTLLMEEFLGKPEEIRSKMVKSELGEWYTYYEQLKAMQEAQGIQARLPFLIEVQ
ncbi:MAG: signal peptide peptidase SppA [Phaeodactylibacter sp.]|nr:signal peptide peptidase SppA [Phaeodactylibacter sp.]